MKVHLSEVPYDGTPCPVCNKTTRADGKPFSNQHAYKVHIGHHSNPNSGRHKDSINYDPGIKAKWNGYKAITPIVQEMLSDKDTSVKDEGIRSSLSVADLQMQTAMVSRFIELMNSVSVSEALSALVYWEQIIGQVQDKK